MSTATAVRRDEPALQREAKLYGGLCAKCLNASECTFPRDPARPVRSCEEFELSGTPPARSLTLVVPTPEPEDAGTSELKGLCRQCAIRITCRYPKPEGGVWHCDELV